MIRFINKNFYKIVFLISILVSCFNAIIGFKYVTIWYDEIFSLAMIKLPVDMMITELVNDVHPILYYLILRFFVSLFSLFGFKNIIALGVFVSLLPICLLLIFNYFVIKKTYGEKVMAWFSLFLVAMPLMLRYSNEIRMYSWAIFFVTLVFFYLKKILDDRTNWKDWIIITIAAIVNIYSLFCCCINGFMYLLFLIYILVKNRSLIKKYILSTFVIICGFLPCYLIF